MTNKLTQMQFHIIASGKYSIQRKTLTTVKISKKNNIMIYIYMYNVQNSIIYDIKSLIFISSLSRTTYI